MQKERYSVTRGSRGVSSLSRKHLLMRSLQLEVTRVRIPDTAFMRIERLCGALEISSLLAHISQCSTFLSSFLI
jgi:hypothetical protein